jgi:hypothetical protein
MGMAASQARWISLAARKTNVEYEGQQINQQRTTLSNESSNYYSQLCNLVVPTPPSSEDFTKTTYTFEDGSESNTIDAIIAQGNGMYIVNYTQNYQTENVVSNGMVVTTRDFSKSDPDLGAPAYLIGGNQLRLISPGSVPSVNDFNPASGKYSYDKYMVSLYNEGKYEEMNKILQLEQQYCTMLNEKYVGKGVTPESWFVRYQLNTNTNTYEPVFYNKEQIVNADYNDKTGASLSGIKSYIYGQTNESKEVRNAKARVEQDVSGRYISIFIYDLDASGEIISEDKGTEYKLNATTESDDRAYNDAMNQYNYDKAKYDQEVQSINAKIEIIQGQDKDLELRLKQLDTEENAISTEMEAVKKVISKNVESSFKTFNA